MKIAIGFICLLMGCCALAQEQDSNYKTIKVAVRDTIFIDSVSINPSRFLVKTKQNTLIDSTKYRIDFSKSVTTTRCRKRG